MHTPAPTPMDVQSAGRVDISHAFGWHKYSNAAAYIVETLHVYVNR